MFEKLQKVIYFGTNGVYSKRPHIVTTLQRYNRLPFHSYFWPRDILSKVMNGQMFLYISGLGIFHSTTLQGYNRLPFHGYF